MQRVGRRGWRRKRKGASEGVNDRNRHGDRRRWNNGEKREREKVGTIWLEPNGLRPSQGWGRTKRRVRNEERAPTTLGGEKYVT